MLNCPLSLFILLRTQYRMNFNIDYTIYVDSKLIIDIMCFKIFN